MVMQHMLQDKQEYWNHAPIRMTVFCPGTTEEKHKTLNGRNRKGSIANEYEL